MAFNFDGAIYTCDEGRMAARMGHDNFRIGDVSSSRFNELIDHDVTKTMCVASCLDNHAGCADCAYKPYCGVCPLVHYMEYGTIFPQISATDQCKIKIAMFDYLFSKITTPKMKVIFERWLERPALFQ
jgi:radical SAM protein with 4Fe4S-binding SPASM domain